MLHGKTFPMTVCFSKRNPIFSPERKIRAEFLTIVEFKSLGHSQCVALLSIESIERYKEIDTVHPTALDFP